MRKRSRIFLLKIFIGLLIFNANAQSDSTNNDHSLMDDWDNLFFVIPFSDEYDFSWDYEHVDSPAFNPSEMYSPIFLELVDDDDCFFYPPVESNRVTSHYGWRWNRMHRGTDIGLNTGDTIRAVFDGVVRMDRYNPGGYGNYIVIRHYNGLETLYAHMSMMLVSRNQVVRAGDPIGLGGSTGRSTGPHLHFETRYKGQAFDAERIFDFENQQLKDSAIWIEKNWFMNPTTQANRSVPAKSVTGPKYHTVRKGETLGHIARKYGTSVTKLCQLNGIRSSSILRIGQKIRVK